MRQIDIFYRGMLRRSRRLQFFFGGFAKKGYTSLFLRQKGAHLKNIWAIYTKRSMISYCAPFWRKNTGEYPPVSIQLNMYPLFAVDITPFGENTTLFPEQNSSTSRQHNKALVRFSPTVRPPSPFPAPKPLILYCYRRFSPH